MLCRILTLVVLFTMPGCQNPLLRSQSPEKEPPRSAKKPDFTNKVNTKLLGEYMSVHGNAPVVLQAVGLVTGLDRTGGDPPPSVSRTALREEMTRRGVKHPEMILRSQSTALVIVRAYLPPLAHKGQKMDIEVRLPQNSNATSLRGGWLMQTTLTEQQATAGGIKEGREYALAEGPILITGGEGEDKAKVAQFKRGVILGGGRSLAERDLTIVLRNDYRSVRMAKRISDTISKRFFHYNKYGNREALAKGVSDQQIELKLHPRYRDNEWRYKQVVRHISFKESEVAARLRQQQLREDLMDPAKAAKAALQFEAIGRDSIPFLKR
ncbi:MAG: flagellar basal body P-ring protein FlgI, partial [Planctomycetaceae bacterium]